MSSKLLIDEPPLQVLPSLAEVLGLNEAIIVQQVHYWLRDTPRRKQHDGYSWVYNSYTEWQKQFPFWSTDTIQRGFTSAERQKVLISRQEPGFNRRKWYRLNYDALNQKILDRNNPSSMTATCHDGLPQVAVISLPQNATMLTEREITTENTNLRAPARAPRVLQDPVADLLTRSEKADPDADLINAFPEHLRDYARAFIRAAPHVCPVKRELSRWRNDLGDIYEAGFTPADIPGAVRAARENGTSIKTPGSILYALRDGKAQKKSSQPNYIEVGL